MLMVSGIMAGFGNVTADYKEQELVLDKLLIEHPSATFIARANGNNMRSVGIHCNDILIVDRSLRARHLDVVLVVYDESFYCRQYDQNDRVLFDDNNRLALSPERHISFEGVITRSIRCHRMIPELPSVG